MNNTESKVEISSHKEKKIKKSSREIAREARERKKVYLQILETKMEGIQAENERMKVQITELNAENDYLKRNISKET